MIHRRIKNNALLLLVLILSIPVILPYFHSGFFPTHDGLWAVVRLGDMFRELKDHQFPPRWSGVLNFGYGYPLFNFAYPFPYYLGMLIHLFHIPFITTIKLLFAISVPISAVGMYLLSKKLWASPLAGFFSSMLYIYLPYRMVDLYVRGSLGESIALAIVPFLLLCLVLAQEKKSIIPYVCGSMLLAGLITTHNIMGLFFTPILFLFAVVYGITNKKSVVTLLPLFLLGLGLSAFFWLPAIIEKQWIYLAKIPIADRTINFVSFSQLFFSAWQYGLPGTSSTFTFQLGWAQAITTLGVVAIALVHWVKKIAMPTVLWVFLAVLMGFILLLFPFTNPVWSHIPLLKEINYPWTLLAPIGFIMSMLAGFLAKSKQKMVSYVLILVVAGAIIQIIPFAQPQNYIYQPDSYFLTNDANTTSSSEYTPLWVKQFPLKRPDQKVVVAKGNITNEVFSSNKFAFDANLPQESLVTINTIYYPGWKMMVDNQIVPITYNNQYGVMQITILQGQHQVQGRFTETPLRLLADILSVLSVVITLMFLGIAFARRDTSSHK